jgi:hypothetical protein
LIVKNARNRQTLTQSATLAEALIAADRLRKEEEPGTLLRGDRWGKGKEE